MDCMGHTSVNLEDANGSLPFYQYNCFADRSYHLAITGKSFALVCEHYPELLEKVRVFPYSFCDCSYLYYSDEIGI